MSIDKLFELGKPCFYMVQTDESTFTNLYMQLTNLHEKAIIRMVRGKKSKTVQAFFNEIAATLQFPYYFGENWPAFDECITDLDWLKGEAYLLMLSNANFLLSDADSKDFCILMRSLSTANEEWLTPNKYIPRNRQPTPFHVLFQTTESDFPAFSKRLVSCGVDFKSIQLTKK